MIIRRIRTVSLASILLAGSFCALPDLNESRTSFADETKDDGPKKDTPPVPNQQQLNELLKLMFGLDRNGGQRPGNRQMQFEPDDSIDDQRADGTRDPIENRAPRDPKADQLLHAGDVAARQRDFKSALDLYQRLLDRTDDVLNRTPDRQWQPLRRTVNQRIGTLPEPAIAEYRSQYGGLAKQHLQQAHRSGKIADYVQVAERFFHTPAGYEAAYIVASWHFDRSEFGLAARWFDELAGAPVALARNDAWLLQAALALTKAGRVDRGRELLKKLSGGPETTVTLGTGPVQAAEFLQQAVTNQDLPEAPLSNWPQIYGTAARVGTTEGGDALLSANWSLSLTSNSNALNSIRWLLHDLQDMHRSSILAAQPLAVDGRVIYRDLRGLRCVDIESGNVLWEGVEGVSPERILSGVPAQQMDLQDTWRLPNNAFSYLGDYQGQSAEYSPLANILFRDATYGLVSSDGQQVFAIEDQGLLSSRQLGHHWNNDVNTESQDAFGVPWKTNRLVSYELSSGRAMWSIGGTESREAFDLPLAGWYFYGAPAAEGNVLYLVAGKGDEIRLWALDRRNGTPQWSQLIAYSDTKIDQDQVRRWNASQVAVANGVVVCPTTVGWLIAVDRLKQSVLWAYRYIPRTGADRSEREADNLLLQNRELNAQWATSAPIISGNYVVYTPQDHEAILCLDLAEGRKLWEHPKDQGLYLAGVFDGKAIVANQNGLMAYRLSDGTVVWNERFDEGTRVAGRGIATESRYYVPLTSGELRSVSLLTGKTESQSYVGSREPALGNLVMHRGKLISLSPNGLAVFGQREAVAEEIRSRLAQDSNDAWALFRSGEIELLNRNYEEGASLLRRAAQDRLTPSESARHHSALVECLSKLIRANIRDRNAELDELGRLATSAEDRMLYRELAAEKHLAESDSVKAFEIFCQLADEAGDSFVVRSDNRNVTVRRTEWLGGRIFEIWFANAHADQKLIDEHVRATIAERSERSAEACLRAARLFAFHPASLSARERYVGWLTSNGDVIGARLVLQSLSESDDRSVAARATEKLALSMIDAGLYDDAVYYYQQLNTQFATVSVRDNLTGAEIVTRAKSTSDKLNFESTSGDPHWKDSPMRLEHSVLNPAPESQEVVLESALPFFNRQSLEAWQNDQRLTLESTTSGQVEGIIPLRSAMRAGDDGYLTVNAIGHQIYFINRGILHAVSPIERRVIWSQTIDDSIEGGGFSRLDGRAVPSPMVSAGHENSEQSLFLQRSNSMGQLAIVQPNYLCLHGRRSLSVLDPQTGDELWKLDGLPSNAQITGSRDAIFLYDGSINEAKAYRVSDGKALEIPSLTRMLNNALVSHGSSLLLLEHRNPDRRTVASRRLRNQSCVLRLHDPVTDQTGWKLELPKGTVVSPLGQTDAVAVQPDGTVKRIEIATGRVTGLEIPGSAPPPIKKNNLAPAENYLLADEQRIYLVLNHSDSDLHTFGESLSSIRTDGTILAWNRHDNHFLWRQSIKGQNLIVDRFAKSPALVFVSRRWRPRRRADVSIGSLSIQAIHKQTGRILLDTKFPSAYNAFQSIDINVEDHAIELKSYNIRMRLISSEDGVESNTEKNPGE